MSDSKNDSAWRELFSKYRIAEEIEEYGFYVIKSAAINEFREARLMTKFDYRSQLPKIFSENKLSILPVSRGSYIISDFETFMKFEDDEVETERIEFPNFLESIDYKNITSETTAINCAYVSGIIQKFVGDSTLRPTVSGRMSSSSFAFTINSEKGIQKVEVANAQIEIDAGYEGENALCLIEAKNSISDDFLIRQLYYPFRLWNEKVHKKVRPLFLTYTNGIFHFREYIFEDPSHYNSLKLLREKKYIIREGVINKNLIEDKITTAPVVPEPQVPFPQADSFERVINLCELLNENGCLNKEEITVNYDFNVRQTNYYTDAGRYLGLIAKEKREGQIVYFLTQEGNRLFDLPIIDRQIRFIELILSHLVFKRVIQLYLQNKDFKAQEVVDIMRNSDLYGVGSETTFKRRASTIIRWVEWIIGQAEDI